MYFRVALQHNKAEIYPTCFSLVSFTSGLSEIYFKTEVTTYQMFLGIFQHNWFYAKCLQMRLLLLDTQERGITQ